MTPAGGFRGAVAAAALLALATPAWRAVAAQEPEVVELDAGGVPVIVKRVPNGVVSAQVFLRGGSANLTPETAGIERLMLEAATRGTERFPKDVFNARLAATGTTIAGTAGHDYSTFALRTVRDSWDEAWDLFADALLRPALVPQEVELARGQILNDVRRRRDNPDLYLREVADSLFFAGHAYAVNPEGTEFGLDHLEADAVHDWHGRRLTKDNLLLVVVGDLDPESVRAKAAAAFESLPAAGDTGRVAGPTPQAPAALAVIERQLPTNYVRGTFRAPGLAEEQDYAAMSLALSLLSDRLFEEVRTKRNLSYAVFSGLSTRLANYGVLYVTAVDPDTTLRVMLDEVRRLQEEAVPDSILEATRNVFETEYWMGLETNEAQAAVLGRYELVGGGWEEAEDFIDEVRAVSADELRRVMQEYVGAIRFAVLGDPARIDRKLFTSM